MRRLFAVALVAWSLPLPAKTVLKKTVAADESSPTGEIEFRPSWTPADNHFFGFNYGEVGFKTSSKFWIGYQQQFTTELQTPKPGDPVFKLFDGFLRSKINKVWVDADNPAVSLSLEPRLYLPTDPEKADAGLIGMFLPYFKLTGEVSSDFSITLKEGPSIDVYSRDGVMSGGKPKANPYFDNWIWLTFDYVPQKGFVQFSLPLILISSRYRDFDPRASHNDDWGHQFIVYPELTFVIEKHIFVGAAYESDDLVKVQDGEAGAGTWQVFLRTSF